jgi:ABC-type Mn2+/Zn2+ transport system permease subunit
MLKRFNSNIITALCTGGAIIAFAFYRSYITVPAGAFYVAAATICLLPVAFASARRKACRSNASNAR